MLILLGIIIVLLLILSYKMYGYDIIHPTIGYMSIFLLATINSLTNMSKWNFDLLPQTLIVITFSMIILMLCSSVSKRVIKKENRWELLGSDCRVIEVPTSKLMLYVAFELIIGYLMIKEVREIASQFGRNASLGDAIYFFRLQTTYTTQGSGVGYILSNMYMLCRASGYVFSYVLGNNLVCNSQKEHKWKAFIAVVLNILLSLITGVRGYMVMYMVIIFITYFSIKARHQGIKKISLRLILKLSLILISLVFVFVKLTGLLGRTSSLALDFYSYISIYIGAPLCNLNYYISNFVKPHRIFGQETFISFINWIGHRLNNSDLIYSYVQDFRFYRGVNLGNVYTGYKAYIADFGLVGSCIPFSFMSFIITILYEKSCSNRNNKLYPINNYLLFYGLLYYCFIMTYFSNTFYEFVINVNFIKTIIFILVTESFFWLKIRVSFRNHSKGRLGVGTLSLRGIFR